MNKSVRFILFTLLVVVVGAGLCFGQINPRTKQEKTPPPVAPAPTAAAAPAAQDTMAIGAVKFDPGLVPVVKNDGLQCLLDNASGLNAAYAEAAQSGCKKVKVGQATLYNCGFHPSPYYSKCQAAKAKIDAIFQKCGITPPVNQGGMEGMTAGCNSLGINCMESPS